MEDLRQKVMGGVIVLTTILTIFQGTVFGENSDNQLRVKEGFIFTLPDNWVQIPKDVLNDFSEELHQSTPKIKKQVIDYGFQTSSSDYWFDFPYIVVQVKNTGRKSKSRYENLPKIDRELNKGASKAESLLKTVLSNVETGSSVYDKEDQTLYSTMTSDVIDVGRVKNLTSEKLTEKGTINIYAYSLENEFDKYSSLFFSFTKNLKLDGALKYQPRMIDNILFISDINWEKWLIYGLAFAISVLLFSFFRRKIPNN